MKILKLLNKIFFFILLINFFLPLSYAEDQPVDIWNLDQEKKNNNSIESQNDIDSTSETQSNSKNDIYKMQTQKNESAIEFDQNFSAEEIKIIGLYDPEDYDLDIDMWTNSNGDQLKNLLSKLSKIKLSNDASEILKITLLTNSYLPKKNITEKEFLKLKSDWLIKNSDFELIEEYLIKNQIVNLHPELTKYLVDNYLSSANIEKACEIFSKISENINDDYLSKFKIYCLIYSGKREEAQLILDLKKETGLINKYFEKKISYLLGYNVDTDNSISEKSILDFHLAQTTNKDFNFEPKESTDKIIWKYLLAFNLLDSFKKIEISELEKISTLERATHNKDYPEQDLFEIYKRFQFNINQLLNVERSYKNLSNIEGRALIYQKILLESEFVEKLKLLKLLKNLFKKDELSNAFDIELKKFLKDIDPTEIPDNLTSFYYTNIKINENQNNEIKINNDILHQSKIENYFNGDYSKSKIEKEINNFLNKIKKNKKYFLSRKDQILIESLKFDGIEIDQKYDDLFEENNSEIPTDIQVMVNNNEKGAAMLRIIEIIGQDKLERIDEDTLYFIVRVLNQLNIDFIRNQILLKVLPLKV